MVRHYMTQGSEDRPPQSVREIMKKYQAAVESENPQMTEGMEPMGPLGGAVPAGGAAPDMGTPAGTIMPPPAVAPPLPAARGVPGAAGDASLSPPPEVPEEKLNDKRSSKTAKETLRAIREALMDLEIKLRELGALDEEEPEDNGAEGGTQAPDLEGP